MKVEVQYRWLLPGSAAVLYTLRNHRVALAIYVSPSSAGAAHALWLLAASTWPSAGSAGMPSST
ncbi:MAG: hypothetical protein R3F43_21405 [bacterium]